MSLSLGELEGWDVAAVREVAAALATRGDSTGDIRVGLGGLPMIASWQGSSGDAARSALDTLATDLAVHGLEMARVSSATAAAADDIERLQDGLRRLVSDARHEGFTIDMATGEVRPRRPDMVGDPIHAWQQAGLEMRVKALLDAADATDADLARAITAARDAPTAPPSVPDPLSAPIPIAASEFRMFWERLTSEQKDVLYRRDHAIGNRDGMPAVDRDYYNRLTLAVQTASATAARDRTAALHDQHPDWAGGDNVPPPNRPGTVADDRLRYERWQRQYDAARGDARYLPDLHAVSRAADGADRLLLVLDTAGGPMTHAAVAIGNPDTAEHVSVTAPGLNTTVDRSLPEMTEDAVDLRQESLRQLQSAPGRTLDSVSTIAWIGYDTPQIAGFDDAGAMLGGGWDVSHGQAAWQGAHALAGFYDGLAASHHRIPLHLTAIGHSYGSLTTGLALQLTGDHSVADVIFYGSPGVAATTPDDLHVDSGHVFTMQTPDDPIRHVFDTPWLHAGATVLPAPFDAVAESVLRTLLLTGAGQFGPDPATNPNFTRLETGPATVSNGTGATVTLGAARGHSEYADFGEDGNPRTTSYNIAAVVAGLYDNVIRD
jgi:hypothetical protein